MADNKQQPDTNPLEAELTKAKAELTAYRNALIKSGAPEPISGSYKGHTFAAGHRRVRDAKGAMCDTQMLLDAAADPTHENHAAACALLDRLIGLKYAYFTKEAPASDLKKK